ncbi:uncharacterized protein BKCO1_5500069 [Diplodia corticola]|uniref:Uncharacterized protein n=1 Tax=Diplodia corticola TaxID=236234 RepID=A0A1J9RSF7_9PEZI|nr:uncharacterized protein BKCO1_5500069 [Diplodia corticola]OJD30812.1 hypothetical protein BKCO1_5500069 [Diplodia corticola]
MSFFVLLVVGVLTNSASLKSVFNMTTLAAIKPILSAMLLVGVFANQAFARLTFNMTTPAAIKPILSAMLLVGVFADQASARLAFNMTTPATITPFLVPASTTVTTTEAFFIPGNTSTTVTTVTTAPSMTSAPVPSMTSAPVPPMTTAPVPSMATAPVPSMTTEPYTTPGQFPFDGTPYGIGDVMTGPPNDYEFHPWVTGFAPFDWFNNVFGLGWYERRECGCSELDCLQVCASVWVRAQEMRDALFSGARKVESGSAWWAMVVACMTGFLIMWL